jgi:hypothetical protein
MKSKMSNFFSAYGKLVYVSIRVSLIFKSPPDNTINPNYPQQPKPRPGEQ